MCGSCLSYLDFVQLLSKIDFYFNGEGDVKWKILRS